MTALLDFLSDQGPTLAVGASAILGLGWLCVLLASQPIHRQRLAELSVASAILWLVLAVIPLPRAERSANVASSADEEQSLRLETMPPSAKTALVPTLSDINVPPIPPIDLASLPPIPSPPIDFSETPVPTVSEPSEIPQPFPIRRTAAGLYLVAMAFSALVLAAALWRLRRLVKRSAAAGPLVLARWRRLGPPKRARLLLGPQSSPPLSFGVLKPTVLAPSRLAEAGGQELDAVFRHEIAHLRHRDPLSRALFNSAMPILGLHPVYWLLRRQAMFAAELRADAGAAASCGAEHYVDSLVRLFNQGGRSRRLLAASTVWGSESEFCRRMTMLLKSSRPIRQRTSRTWSTVASLLALAAVVVFADQCGVVYAQTARKAANQPTEEAVVSPVETTKETAKTANPFAVRTSTAKATKARRELAPDDRVITTPAPQTADPTTARAGYGSPFGAAPQRSPDAATAWDAINIQIADRRARLAGARALPEKEPFEALRLELEVMALESSKRQLDLERRAQAAEKQLQDLARENETLRAATGPDHPGLAQVAERMKRLEDQVMVLRKQMEIEQEQSEDRIRARAAHEVRKTEPAKTSAVKTKESTRSSSADEIRVAQNRFTDAQTQFAQAQVHMQDAQAQIAKLRDENANLRSQLQALQQQFQEQQQAQMKQTFQNKARNNVPTVQRSPNDPLTQTQRELPSMSRSQEPGQGLPYVKHQLRVAESELPLYQARLAQHNAALQRVENLHSKGAISAEEIDAARAQIEFAKAELRKAQTNIASLQKLIDDLDSDAKSKATAPPKR